LDAADDDDVATVFLASNAMDGRGQNPCAEVGDSRAADELGVLQQRLDRCVVERLEPETGTTPGSCSWPSATRPWRGWRSRSRCSRTRTRPTPPSWRACCPSIPATTANDSVATRQPADGECSERST